MKVFVAGASGRVGRELVADLVAAGHEVVAASRHPEGLEGEHVRGVRFDMHAELPEIEEAMAGCDAAYFVAGSRGKDLLQTDAFGAVKTMMACEDLGIRRYVMLSSMYAMQPGRWASEPGIADITDYNIAKFFADEWLVHNTDLDYTIVQAAILKEEPGTGLVQVEPPHDTEIPIPDVAQTLADVLEMGNTYGKVIMVTKGATPIAEALATV